MSRQTLFSQLLALLLATSLSVAGAAPLQPCQTAGGDHSSNAMAACKCRCCQTKSGEPCTMRCCTSQPAQDDGQPALPPQPKGSRSQPQASMVSLACFGSPAEMWSSADSTLLLLGLSPVRTLQSDHIRIQA